MVTTLSNPRPGRRCGLKSHASTAFSKYFSSTKQSAKSANSARSNPAPLGLARDNERGNEVAGNRKTFYGSRKTTGSKPWE